jgi:type IV secretion system protein VirB5
MSFAPQWATRSQSNGNGNYTPAANRTPVSDSERSSRPNEIVANARREFVSAFGDLARGKRNWQIAAFAFAALAITEALTAFRLAVSAHPIPYLVAIDRIGSVTPIASAEQLREPEARLVSSQLADFIRSVRAVLPVAAATAQSDLLRRAYALTTSPATGFLNSYFSDPTHDPRLLGSRMVRDVRVTSALKVPEPAKARRVAGRQSQTWRLQWVESDRPIGPLDASDSSVVAAWEGYVTLDIVPPKTVEAIQDNPLGIRITSITWTRIAGQLVPRDSVSTLLGPSHDGGVQ